MYNTNDLDNSEININNPHDRSHQLHVVQQHTRASLKGWCHLIWQSTSRSPSTLALFCLENSPSPIITKGTTHHYFDLQPVPPCACLPLQLIPISLLRSSGTSDCLLYSCTSSITKALPISTRLKPTISLLLPLSSMAEVQSRPAAPRGRASSHRSGRGSHNPRGGSRSAPRHSSTLDVSDTPSSVPLDEQGELGQLKIQYRSELSTLNELFPDWTDDDLVFGLQEHEGDLQTTIERITEGNPFSLNPSIEGPYFLTSNIQQATSPALPTSRRRPAKNLARSNPSAPPSITKSSLYHPAAAAEAVSRVLVVPVAEHLTEDEVALAVEEVVLVLQSTEHVVPLPQPSPQSPPVVVGMILRLALQGTGKPQPQAQINGAVP